MVRSNPEKKVGFLSDQRRMNVAITRAKTFVGIICDSSTVSSNPFLAGIVKYINEKGQTIHAKEYSMDPDFKFSKGAFESSQKPKNPSEKKPKKPKTVPPKPKIALTDPIESQKKLPEEAKIIKSDRNQENEPVYDYEKEREARLINLQKIVDEFITSDRQFIEFGEDLTGYDRLQIHKYVSEKYKEITHLSEGEGHHRKLVLRKPVKIEENKTQDIESQKKELIKYLSPEQQERIKKSEEEQKKKEIRQLKKKRAKERKEKHNKILTLAELEAQNKVELNKEQKEEVKKVEIKLETDKDVEEMLDKMIHENKTCNFVDDKGNHCTKPCDIFGRVCHYCMKQFCLEHVGISIHKCPMNHQPEKVRKADPAALKAAVNEKLSKLKELRSKKIKKK